MQQLNDYELAREERIRKNREELQRLTAGLEMPSVVRLGPRLRPRRCCHATHLTRLACGAQAPVYSAAGGGQAGGADGRCVACAGAHAARDRATRRRLRAA
jgi:hypothetical protein